MILLAAGFVALFVLGLAFWVLNAIVWLIGRILGIQLRFPGIILLLAVLGAFLAGSIELDRVGVVRSAQIIDKQEYVVVRTRGDWITAGDWTDHRTFTVRYSPNGDPLPRFTSTSAALAEELNLRSTVESAILTPSVADFDRLRPGDSLDVRILRVGTLFSIVRPANQTTWTLILLGVVEGGLTVVALVYLAWLLRKTPVGYLPLTGVLVIAFCVPLVLAYRTWHEMDDVANATVHATATVGPVTRITKVQIGDEERGGGEFDLWQPYDVVQLEFVPPNYPDSIIAIDEVDANVGQAPRFTTGSHLEVVYPPDNPRAVRIPGQTRTHYLQTTLLAYEKFGEGLFFLGVLVFVGGVISRGWRGLYRRRRDAAATNTSSDVWSATKNQRNLR